MRSPDEDGLCSCAFCKSKVHARKLKCRNCKKVTKHIRGILDLAEGYVWVCPGPCLEDREYHSATHFYKGKWWFWDETWGERVGPYNSAVAAVAGCSDYVESL